MRVLTRAVGTHAGCVLAAGGEGDCGKCRARFVCEAVETYTDWGGLPCAIGSAVEVELRYAVQDAISKELEE
jgi:hypothetical protein